jgi:ligand-binding SRPBCC domain-containing protein
MKFEHQFTVHAPLHEVVEFHRHAAGLKALTPPIAFMRFDLLPDPIRQGAVLRFRMWLGPIPVRWESHFPEMTATGFVDTQGCGPFGSWEHRHTFRAVSADVTEVVDHIDAHLRPHLWYGFVGMLMWLTLPVLFMYRLQQTQRLLERNSDQSDS